VDDEEYGDERFIYAMVLMEEIEARKKLESQKEEEQKEGE
jgi:hypothetical protein